MIGSTSYGSQRLRSKDKIARFQAAVPQNAMSERNGILCYYCEWVTTLAHKSLRSRDETVLRQRRSRVAPCCWSMEKAFDAYIHWWKKPCRNMLRIHCMEFCLNCTGYNKGPEKSRTVHGKMGKSHIFNVQNLCTVGLLILKALVMESLKLWNIQHFHVEG